MTPMQAKAAERERLALLDIHPVALMCRSDRVIAEITSVDMLKIVTRYCAGVGETLGLFLTADSGKWVACEGDGCFVEEFFLKKSAIRYLTGQYDDTDKLLAGDRRYHIARVA